jgi:hypothetical protein
MENQGYNKNPYAGNYSNPQQSQPFAQQYAQTQQEAPPVKPKNWMVESILVTVLPCCCNPLSLLGIVAIVYGSKVNNLFFAGQYAEAERASKNAKMWVLITLAVVLVGIVLYAIHFATGGWETFMEEFQRALESAGYGGATW